MQRSSVCCVDATKLMRRLILGGLATVKNHEGHLLAVRLLTVHEEGTMGWNRHV